MRPEDHGPRNPFYRGNVWLLTSIATQADADGNVPELLGCRHLVPVLGLSAEPLVGSVNLQLSRSGYQHVDEIGAALAESGDPWLRQVDWVIVGGESGHGARPMHPDWARSLRDQCAAAGVPFFFKQWGEWLPISQLADGEHEKLYKMHAPTRQQPEGWPVYSVDVRTLPYDPETKIQCHTMFRVGKKKAGRLLDGRLHDEYPRVEIPAQ